MPRSVNVSISALIIVLACFAIATTAGATATRQPQISVSDTSSALLVSGRGFLPRERVTVRATQGDASTTRTVRAATTGRFSAELPETGAGCGPLLVSATGSRGSTAVFRRSRIADPCGIVVLP